MCYFLAFYVSCVSTEQIKQNKQIQTIPNYCHKFLFCFNLSSPASILS